MIISNYATIVSVTPHGEINPLSPNQVCHTTPPRSPPHPLHSFPSSDATLSTLRLRMKKVQINDLRPVYKINVI